MLSGWHLPVSPFVRLADDALHITLWLQGDSLPAQVFLRCEPDNEEWLLTMEGMRAMIVGAIAFLYRYMRAANPALLLQTIMG